jgi:hypothetical protein
LRQGLDDRIYLISRGIMTLKQIAENNMRWQSGVPIPYIDPRHASDYEESFQHQRDQQCNDQYQRDQHLGTVTEEQP